MFINQNPSKLWREGKLADLAREVRVLYEPIKSESLPYVGLEHVEKETLLLSSIDDSSETDSSKRKFEPYDVLFGSLRPYFKKVYKPSFNGVCSTDITVLRAKKGVDPSFLKHLIASYEFIEIASNYSNGSRMPRAKWSDLKKLDWYLPKSNDQIKIGALLEDYSILIENNRRRIEILEKMAQLLYREWFVEFRFPGHEKHKYVDSELGNIPNGWIVSKVSDVAKISRGISYRSDNLVDTGTSFFTINCLYRNGGFKLDGLKFYEGNYKESQLIKSNEIIIGVTDMTQARLIVGSVARIPSSGIGNGLISMDLVRAKAKTGFSNEYVYSMLRYSDFTRTVKEFANGANVLHLSPKHIEKFQFVLPDKEVRDQFIEIMSPIYQLMDNLVQENVLLTQTRDLLLPKLMSGEIDVSKLDINVTKN